MGTFTFTETPLPGAFVITAKRFDDARGTFRMLYVREEFRNAGIVCDYVQTNISTSKKKHTLRGMHFQKGSAAQDKLIRCLRGCILDVIIDIRPQSPTFGRHFSLTLPADGETMIFVPKGFAHGLITLEDDCHVLYQVSAPYAPASEGGIRWNDPRFGIVWPTDSPILSEKDARYPDFQG